MPFMWHHEAQEAANAPLLVLLHGTGGDEHDLIPLARTLLPQANLLGVRGQVREHGAARFFRRIVEGVFDLEDLQHRTAALAEFIERFAAQHHPHSEILALGYSNGANIAASMLLLHPEVLHGAVLLRAMRPFAEEQVTLPDNGSTAHVLLVNGATDPIVAHHQHEQLATMLSSRGATVQREIVPAGHQLTQHDVTFAKRWLAVHARRTSKKEE